MSVLDKFRLDGKVAVITGAGKGIGAGIARAFAEAGADVVIGARTAADLERVAQDIRAMGRRALVVTTDVLDFAQLQRLADRALHGRLEVGDLLEQHLHLATVDREVEAEVELFAGLQERRDALVGLEHPRDRPDEILPRLGHLHLGAVELAVAIETAVLRAISVVAHQGRVVIATV